MEFKDYYQIMGVAREASPAEIKRVYRQLARKYHPDVSKAVDAETRFKAVGEAYAVLKDPEKRAAYDKLGSRWAAGQDFQPPPDWNAGFEFSGKGSPGGDQGAGFGHDSADRTDAFSDFFDALYGQGFGSRSQEHQEQQGRKGRQSAPARGEDHHAKVMIDLEDAYTGATRTITLERPEPDSAGRLSMHSHTLKVTIPRGIRAGQHIRLQGQGTPGRGQGTAGDLYLEIAFLPHAHYRVEQRDVYLDLPLAPWEAALGATVTVPTPNGRVELKVPAGSLAGSTLRLKGRGIPGTTPGDFYTVLTLALPPAGTETANAFYRHMAEQFTTFDPRAELGAGLGAA